MGCPERARTVSTNLAFTQTIIQSLFIKDYWKFGKKDMIELDFDLLLDHLEFFPEDIYITNKALTWTIVLTHEEEPLGKRLIIKDGAI